MSIPLVNGCPEQIRIDDNAVQLVMPSVRRGDEFVVTFGTRSLVEATTLFNLLSMAVVHMRIDVLVEKAKPNGPN
jgi:hypothetical protein